MHGCRLPRRPRSIADRLRPPLCPFRGVLWLGVILPVAVLVWLPDMSCHPCRRGWFPHLRELPAERGGQNYTVPAATIDLCVGIRPSADEETNIMSFLLAFGRRCRPMRPTFSMRRRCSRLRGCRCRGTSFRERRLLVGLVERKPLFGFLHTTELVPKRCVLPDCCARAASGHAVAPPSSVMNSRRFTAQCLPCFQPKG